MRVLYVSSVPAEASPSAMQDLVRLDGTLQFETVAGAAAALVELRAQTPAYRAVFLSPHLPQNEALALIATLRRDRLPLAVVAIIEDAHRHFFAPAVTAGADDVLIVRDAGLVGADETLRRVRNSRHLDRAEGQLPLRVLYVGDDDLAWDLLTDLPFVDADRATASDEGACPLSMFSNGSIAAPDVILIDEQPGHSHALQVVRWVKAHAPDTPTIVLTSPSGADVGGAALELGADDVVSKAGSYRRRLMASLHRRYLRHTAERPAAPEPPPPPAPAREDPVTPIPAASHSASPSIDPNDLVRAQAAEAAAEARLAECDEARRSLETELAAARQALEELRESQAFERAMRDRDRDELSRLRQALSEEREKRLAADRATHEALAGAAAERDALDAAHAATRRALESDLAAAADRLHQVATETQALQGRLEHELRAHASERERLFDSALVGHALVTIEGALLRCNPSFADMFGFDAPDDAVTRSPGRPFDGFTDHAHVVRQLQAGADVSRVESVVRRTNGRALRVLTSAAWLHTAGADAPAIERWFVDLDDRTQLGEQLRLARRLESAGRLAAEMSPDIESGLAALLDPTAPAADRAHGATLVRQLLAFSRRQAKPAGLLSIGDAIARAEPLLRQIAGDAVTFTCRATDAGTIAAGDDDVEQLLAALVFAAASNLPYGGTLALDAHPVRTGFDLRTELTARAEGYGVHAAQLSPTLARLVTRCGGTVRVTDDPGRATILHVVLPY
jgi:DNA-binding NarL/FixJ family response regulator